MIAPLLFALAAFVVACNSSSGTLSLDEFIRQALQADQNHEAHAVPLRNQLDAILGGLGDDAVVPAEAKTTLAALYAEERDFASAMAGLDAPSKSKDVQAEAVSSLQAEVDFGEGIIAQVGAETTLAEFGALFETDEGVQIEKRRTAACEALQQLATDNGITADFTC
jgi:hypothetical protein